MLIGINGTQDDRNIQAEQVHLDCLEPMIYEDPAGGRIIAQ